MRYSVEAGGAQHSVAVIWTANGPRLDGDAAGGSENGLEIIPADDGVILWRNMRQTLVRFARKLGGAEDLSGGVLRAPMPGRVTKLFVCEGDRVVLGDPVAVIEAMKMEHVLHAPANGVVTRLLHGEGEQVDSGAAIVELETDGPNASD
jgi:3-methylcrotonyl-CoA carboxylase alpha subunit